MPDELLDIEINDFEHLDLQSCDALERAVLADFFEAMRTGIIGPTATAGSPTLHLGSGTASPRTDSAGSFHWTSRTTAFPAIFPQELSRLTRLQDVRLGGSRIVGCIPLALLSVPDNDFDGLGVPECSVHIPDYYLRTAVLEAVGKDSGEIDDLRG